MIEIQSVSKFFGTHQALNEINLSIIDGEFVTIFGPNGAGKTTLIRIISGLTQPSKGKIQFTELGSNKNFIKVLRNIGFVSHKPFLYENLTIEENLRFYGKMYELENLEKKVNEIISKFGLTLRRRDLVRVLSRGMEQRLSLARAIIHEPKILLLDEPYTGLDQEAVNTFRRFLNDFHNEGKTIVMTTHDFTHGLKNCTHVIVLSKGSIVYDEQISKINLEDFEKIYFKHIRPQE
ncbi:MAG: heme ABC exporter ATP-binding protein CcmA [Acidobacteriota bacterium]